MKKSVTNTRENAKSLTGLLLLMLIDMFSHWDLRLRDDVKMQTDQLNLLQGRIRDIQRELAEAESQVLPVKFELTRCQREKESLESRVKWLEGELETKTKELYKLRVEDGSNRQSLEAELARARNESGSRLEIIGQLEVGVFIDI